VTCDGRDALGLRSLNVGKLLALLGPVLLTGARPTTTCWTTGASSTRPLAVLLDF
jgi:hypothetical protein